MTFTSPPHRKWGSSNFIRYQTIPDVNRLLVISRFSLRLQAAFGGLHLGVRGSPRRLIRMTFPEYVNFRLDTCDDGGHIVGPASAEGQVHQASAGVLGVGVMFKDLGDRFVVDGLRSGRRCRRAGCRRRAGRACGSRQRRPRGAADDVGHDVAPLVPLGVLGRDRAAVDQGLDERVVAGQLLRVRPRETGRRASRRRGRCTGRWRRYRPSSGSSPCPGGRDCSGARSITVRSARSRLWRSSARSACSSWPLRWRNHLSVFRTNASTLPTARALALRRPRRPPCHRRRPQVALFLGELRLAFSGQAGLAHLHGLGEPGDQEMILVVAADFAGVGQATELDPHPRWIAIGDRWCSPVESSRVGQGSWSGMVVVLFLAPVRG